MLPYSEFNDFKCYKNGPFVSYLFRVSLIGIVWDFCYQNTGELPDKNIVLIMYLPTTNVCYVYTVFEQLPFSSIPRL